MSDICASGTPDSRKDREKGETEQHHDCLLAIAQRSYQKSCEAFTFTKQKPVSRLIVNRAEGLDHGLLKPFILS